MLYLPTFYEALQTGLQDEHGWSMDEIEVFIYDLISQLELFDAFREFALSSSERVHQCLE